MSNLNPSDSPAHAQLLNTTLSGSASPLLPGETPTSETNGHAGGLHAMDVVTADELEEVGERGGLEGAKASKADDARERKTTLDALPPSPPLTRPTSLEQEARNDAEAQYQRDSGSPFVAADPGAAEMDIGEWHPLEQTRDSKDMDFNYTQDTTVIADSAAVASEEKQASSQVPRKQPSGNLRIAVDQATPWVGVEPPTDNNDRYSTLGRTKNFESLQNSHRERPRIPHSSYYFGPPPVDSAYGTNPVGHIGVHHPREIFRVERDYTGGELVQFAATYPLELEGRITHTQFLETINAINELLISAHSIKHSFFDNVLAVFTLQISRLFVTSYYEKEMRRLEQLIQDLNTELYNPVGLHIRWPRNVAFMFLEIEYY